MTAAPHWDEVEDWDDVVPPRPVWTSAPGFDAPLHGWSFHVQDRPLPEVRRDRERAAAERAAREAVWREAVEEAYDRARERWLLTLPNRDADWNPA